MSGFRISHCATALGRSCSVGLSGRSCCAVYPPCVSVVDVADGQCTWCVSRHPGVSEPFCPLEDRARPCGRGSFSVRVRGLPARRIASAGARVTVRPIACLFTLQHANHHNTPHHTPQCKTLHKGPPARPDGVAESACVCGTCTFFFGLCLIFLKSFLSISQCLE